MRFSDMMLNKSLLVAKLAGRATCVLGGGTRLASTARILNNRKDSSLIRVGQNCVIRGELFLFGHGGSIEIGDYCYVGEGSRIWSAASVKIGDNVMISHNVDIIDNLTHPLDAEERRQHFRAILTQGHPERIELGERPVSIERDAWIAAGACILRGVTIGEGAIVAARAVVTKDVAPFTMVAGNPARIIRNADAAE